MLPGQSSTDIFGATELWFAKTFKDSRAVLEVKNTDAKIFYGEGINSYHMYSRCYAKWSYNIEIKIKDNKLHYTFSNIIHDKVDCGSIKNTYSVSYYYEYTKAKAYGDDWPKMKADFDKDIDLSLKSLEQEIKTYSKDW